VLDRHSHKAAFRAPAGLQLLDSFDNAFGREARAAAALALYPRLEQPLAFWQALLPTFTPEQQARLWQE
jgi:hypothetical protein